VGGSVHGSTIRRWGEFHCHNWQVRYLSLFLLLVSFQASAQTVYQGKVVKIADGDTLTILANNQQLKIRLSEIDTPERKQPFGTRAKQALSELAFGKLARVVEVTVDRYGRIVGRVYVGKTDVNRELVAQGFAWVYRKYSNDAELLRLEAEAKQKGLGLWADPNPIPPWEWRRRSAPKCSVLAKYQNPVPMGDSYFASDANVSYRRSR
jgi:endonuclease YncB( thermonuclease family)